MSQLPKMDSPNKILIIRFSSFGDIMQGLSATQALKQNWPLCELHWVTRKDYSELLSSHRLIDRVWGFDRSSGLMGLIRLGYKLRCENFSHVYDAHNNLRSYFLRFLLLLRRPAPKFVVRSKFRLKRMLLFWFRRNHFEKPFRGSKSYVTPLAKWGLKINDLTPPFRLPIEIVGATLKQHGIEDRSIVLVPSAAWSMKTWPFEHWLSLTKSLIQQTNHPLVILGGASDQVCFDLKKGISNDRVLNLAGKLTLTQSCAVIQSAAVIISADTGLMHAGDQMGVKTLALLGPTAFGHPLFKNSESIEVPLNCRPCTKDGRGRCVQKVYQKCMQDITAERVLQSVIEKISNPVTGPLS
jgi:ADP-heptose:LPS heptosyltransferase